MDILGVIITCWVTISVLTLLATVVKDSGIVDNHVPINLADPDSGSPK